MHQGTRATLTGMAQRQRAGLITPRSLDRNELPVSISIQLLYRSSTRPHMDTFNRHGAAAARAAHNREDTRSKRVAGIHFNLPALQKQAVKLDAKRSWHWYNSEEEMDCRSKVVRSKLTVNAIQFTSFTETGVITKRPHIITSHRCIKALEQNITELV